MMGSFSSKHAAYINLAAKFTESPITEYLKNIYNKYSLLDPLVPTTPANTNPVAIPILHLQFIFDNSSYMACDVRIALVGSSY